MTTYDDESMAGFSGSLLCLGKVTDNKAYVVLFQNFQSPIKPQEVVQDHKAVSKFGHFATFKAGFLLTAEIRAATIKMEEESVMAVPRRTKCNDAQLFRTRALKPKKLYRTSLRLDSMDPVYDVSEPK